MGNPRNLVLNNYEVLVSRAGKYVGESKIWGSEEISYLERKAKSHQHGRVCKAMETEAVVRARGEIRAPPPLLRNPGEQGACRPAVKEWGRGGRPFSEVRRGRPTSH